MEPLAIAVSTIVSKLYDVIKDEYKGSKKIKKSRELFFEALRETIDASMKRKNLSISERPGVEYPLNQVLTDESFFNQYFSQRPDNIGFRFQELFVELDLKKHLVDPEDIEFFQQALLDKLRLKLPDRYQNFLVEKIYRGQDYLVDGMARLLKNQPQPNSQPNWNDVKETYLNWLFAETSQVYLAGIDPQAKGKVGSALKLSAVYTALLTQTPEKDETELRSDFSQKTKYVSALEQLNRHHRLVLMGDPGGGKSTFVNFVAMCLASECMAEKKTEAALELLTAPLPDDEGKPGEERQAWNQGALLPLRIILRDFAASGLLGPTVDHFWRFLEKDFKARWPEGVSEPLRRELMRQGGLILLDGLDEVPETGARSQLKQAVEDLAKAYPKCRIIVTSRTYAYQRQDWKLNGFAEAILTPFSDGQIRCFVDCWYEHTAQLMQKGEHWSKAGAEALKQAIFRKSRLYPLAQRPLLLTLMASLHAWRSGQLPEKREQLYEETMTLLFDVWETAKKSYGPDGREIIEPGIAEFLKLKNKDGLLDALCHLAYEAHQKQPETTGTADISEGDLLIALKNLATGRSEGAAAGESCRVEPERPDITLLADYLRDRAGLLLPRGSQVFTFPHRTFQEYLAARYLCNDNFPYQLAQLVREDPNRWREVALLAGAKAGRGSSFATWALVRELCCEEVNERNYHPAEQRAALVAGQLIVESIDYKKTMGRPDQITLECVKRWLVSFMERGDMPVVERAEAGRVLGKIGDPRGTVTTIDKMEFCLVPGGPFWMGSDDFFSNEKPLRLCMQIDDDYWISRYPVTNAQFAFFIADEGYGNPAYWIEAQDAGVWREGKVEGRYDIQPRNMPVDFGEPYNLPNHPMLGITWYEALAFTRWLNLRWRSAGLLEESQQVRLPSEAEWEKAAHGGELIPEEPLIRRLGEMAANPGMKDNPLPKRKYPWGGKDVFDSNLINGGETGIGATTAVGCFPAGVSPYGVAEMSGNVWEWCRDDYDDEKRLRVLRGGSWFDRPGNLRASCRFCYDPDYWFNNIGFRVLISVARAL